MPKTARSGKLEVLHAALREQEVEEDRDWLRLLATHQIYEVPIRSLKEHHRLLGCPNCQPSGHVCSGKHRTVRAPTANPQSTLEPWLVINVVIITIIVIIISSSSTTT